VTELGGTYAMEDTDSMAIVAINRGGFIPCPGGNLVKNGVEGVNALTWKQVDEIVKKCEALRRLHRDRPQHSRDAGRPIPPVSNSSTRKRSLQ
jgi:hypothetical protein